MGQFCTRLPQVRDVCLALRCSLAVKHGSKWDVDYPLTIRQWKMLILQFADPVQCVTSWSRFYNRTIARNQEINYCVSVRVSVFRENLQRFKPACAAVNVSKTENKISNGYFPVIRDNWDNTRPWKCLTHMKLWDETRKQAACSAWVPPYCSELHPIGPEQYIHSGWEHAEAQQLTNTRFHDYSAWWLDVFLPSVMSFCCHEIHVRLVQRWTGIWQNRQV